MDGVTTAIVVLIFVASIMSSLGGNKGYTTPQGTPKSQVSVAQSLPGLPDPSFSASANSRKAIRNFVGKYRKDYEADQITTSIMRYAQVYDVNPKLVAALMSRESRFNPRAVSSSGAVGLGQLMPSTCKTVGITNPYDIDQNAKGTARYMSYLLDRFKNQGQRVSFALAGYLEGPNAVARKLGYKPHTAAYVRDILQTYHKI
ncbi:MAG: transglycosylase SLT domain-containing protein [bacterium]